MEEKDNNNSDIIHEDRLSPDEQIAQLKEETEQKHNELKNLYFALNAKIDNVSKTIKVILWLNVVIATIGFSLCIINFFCGCPCSPGNKLSCAGIASFVLGSIAFVCSIILACVGFMNESKKTNAGSNAQSSVQKTKWKQLQLFLPPVLFSMIIVVITIIVCCVCC